MVRHVAAYLDAAAESARVVRTASEIAEHLGARFTLIELTGAGPVEERQAQLRELERTLSRVSAITSLTCDHLLPTRLASWVDSHAVDLFVTPCPERNLFLTLIRPWLPPEPTARLRKTPVLFVPAAATRPIGEPAWIAGLATYC